MPPSTCSTYQSARPAVLRPSIRTGAADDQPPEPVATPERGDRPRRTPGRSTLSGRVRSTEAMTHGEPRPPDVDPALRARLAAALDAPVEVVVTLRLPGTPRGDRAVAQQAADRLMHEVAREAAETPERVLVMANLGVAVVRASAGFVATLLSHELVATITLHQPGA